MQTFLSPLTRSLACGFAAVFAVTALPGEEPGSPWVDLRTVMRLAGANNDEIELARVRHVQAIAESKQAWQRFWPTLSLGAGYRGHEGNVQDIAGAVFDASKQQYTVGATVMMDWSPGDIYYQALVAKQRAVAAEFLAEKARRDIVMQAVDRYYGLLAAEADLAVIEDDLRLVQEYAQQLDGAVKAGTAFRADLLRVQTQASRAKLLVRQGQERRDLGAAALAETLRLAPETALRPAKSDLVPVSLMAVTGAESLIAQAQQQRPEVTAAAAVNSAAVMESRRSKVAPLIPSIQAGYVGGGLGGGYGGEWGNFDDQQDFYVGLAWKIGPGGLFDVQRRRIAEAQAQGTALQAGQVKAAVGREVVEALARVKSARDQIRIGDEAVVAADEMVKLAKERQASQLGVVLEYLLARDELTLARRGRVEAVASYNKAQHALVRAVGGPSAAAQEGK
jgi:outer membrane protein TolC